MNQSHRVRKLSGGRGVSPQRKFRCKSPFSEPRSPKLKVAFKAHINIWRSKGRKKELRGKTKKKQKPEKQLQGARCVMNRTSGGDRRVEITVTQKLFVCQRSVLPSYGFYHLSSNTILSETCLTIIFKP